MKLLIADDHALLRKGVIEMVHGLNISDIDEAKDGHETLEKIKTNDYDLLLLDISMPGVNGLDILQHIQTHQLKTKVLVLSFHPQEQYAFRAIELGASGYITKSAPLTEMGEAIKKIMRGEKYIASQFAEKMIFDQAGKPNKQPHETLSQREFQVMLLLAKGQSLKEISEQLFLSPKTVSTYRSRIMQKTGFTTNSELSIYAIKNSLIE